MTLINNQNDYCHQFFFKIEKKSKQTQNIFFHKHNRPMTKIIIPSDFPYPFVLPKNKYLKYFNQAKYPR